MTGEKYIIRHWVRLTIAHGIRSETVSFFERASSALTANPKLFILNK